MFSALKLPSFAKINWQLSVLGRRTDGFHELRTIFQTITLHDELTFAERADGRLQLTCDAPEIPVDERNLIYRAASQLKERYVLPDKGAEIHLEKHIPAQSGLGGGSSNAAVTLLALDVLWNLKLSKDELCAIGARLGADVPFFFTGGTALGTGLGDEITPVPEVSAEHLLIVTPEAKVATAEAYRALNAPALTKPLSDTILAISRADEHFADSFPEALHNDFERVTFELKPEVEQVKKALVLCGARQALMTGSGSSIFGIFENQEAQERAAERLKAETQWRVFSCSTLSRAQYAQALGACAAPVEALL
ncbi:MAG: 4-(cytidine 5'-diphospho)-2-C-methyl-D-erythritol kinase [Pyrinomonadaceae bacterium]|nr:4-(cytidine 5'-diphospho)-2-C-methyl-D-erythritol kinase [Pyrinomonadaceae bacterium]